MEFVARQEGLAGCSKLVFLKTLAKHVATDPTFVELFLHEARIAARLSNDNILQIHELGEVKGEYFIAMEYVHGHHLGKVLETMSGKAQSFVPVLAARLCREILNGLRHAHTLGDEQGRPLNLVHKNLCASNVLLGFTGAVKIYNFGLPFWKAGNSNTLSLHVAPEQYIDGKIDARVDIYATGVLLAKLLLGKFPRNCKDGQQLAKGVFQHPGVPFALADIVSCALAPNRDERFESAREMGLALDHYIDSAGVSQVTVAFPEFLRQLFGNTTDNLLHSYEADFLNGNANTSSPGGVGVVNAMDASSVLTSPPAFLTPPPLPIKETKAQEEAPPAPEAKAAKEAQAFPWEAFQVETSVWEILPTRYRRIFSTLLAAGVVAGLVWWLFQT